MEQHPFVWLVLSAMTLFAVVLSSVSIISRD